MIKATSLLPDEGRCLDPRNNADRIQHRDGKLSTVKGSLEEAESLKQRSKTMKVSPDAERIQKLIAERLWEKFPEISKLRKECSVAEKQTANPPSERCHSSRGELFCDPPTEGELATFQANVAVKNKKCGDLHTKVIPSIWGTSSAEMSSYIDKMTDIYERGLSDFRNKIAPFKDNPTGKASFMAIAVPTKNGKLLYDGDVDWRLSLEGVMESTMCATVDRYNVFKTQLKKAGATEDTKKVKDGKTQHWGLTDEGYSGRISYMYRNEKNEDDANFRKFLLRDGGISAINYMDRTEAYAPMKESLGCHLKNYYYEFEKNRAEVRTYVNAGIVGISMVATGGTSLILAGGALALSLQNVRSVCGNITNNASTLQSEPICKIFQENRKNLDRVQILQKAFENESCKMAQIDVAVDTFGAVTGATAAARLAKLGKEAKLGADGIRSVGDLNKLTRAAERVAGPGKADDLIAMLSSANPEKQKRNFEALNALARHADEGESLFKELDGDGIASIISHMDDPKFIDELALLKKANPAKFQESMEALKTACVKTAATLFDFLISQAHAGALCNAQQIQAEMRKLAFSARSIDPELRSLIQRGYKVNPNVSVERLEQQGYVGFDLLEAPKGVNGGPRKVIAYDGAGKPHILDLQPNEKVGKGFGGQNAATGSNFHTESKVIQKVKKDPKSISESNWQALRSSRRTSLQAAARREAENLGQANKLHSSSGNGLSKGYIKVKYQDGTEGTYRYSNGKQNTYWTDGSGKAVDPKWTEADSVTYVSENTLTKTETLIKDVEGSLPEGLKKGDYTSPRNTASQPSLSTPVRSPTPQTWRTARTGVNPEFVKGQKVKVKFNGKELEAEFHDYMNGDFGSPTFMINGTRRPVQEFLK
ncbi:MAG: hypothetical protein K2X47_13370 [Bdellovibrionales bacterium]|nr:hypothetical protein [Bdellovibrionales bacterium]